jgi:HEPN domain-containing protein
MVLSAFAAELFLKCLLVLETGEAAPTHRLDVLFKRVSHKQQRRIQELWEADGRPKLIPLCRALNMRGHWSSPV